jgi:hypothetical protein
MAAAVFCIDIPHRLSRLLSPHHLLARRRAIEMFLAARRTYISLRLEPCPAPSGFATSVPRYDNRARAQNSSSAPRVDGGGVAPATAGAVLSTGGDGSSRKPFSLSRTGSISHSARLDKERPRVRTISRGGFAAGGGTSDLRLDAESLSRRCPIRVPLASEMALTRSF